LLGANGRYCPYEKGGRPGTDGSGFLFVWVREKGILKKEKGDMMWGHAQKVAARGSRKKETQLYYPRVKFETAGQVPRNEYANPFEGKKSEKQRKENLKGNITFSD